MYYQHDSNMEFVFNIIPKARIIQGPVTLSRPSFLGMGFPY